MSKNKADFLIQAAKDNKTIQMDELLSKNQQRILEIFSLNKYKHFLKLLKKEIKAIWDRFDLDRVRELQKLHANSARIKYFNSFCFFPKCQDGVVKVAEVDLFLKNLNMEISDSERKKVIKLLDR